MKSRSNTDPPNKSPAVEPTPAELDAIDSKLSLELRRGAVVLAALSQLGTPQYGYSLLQTLGDQGFNIEQGTLYPLLRRLAQQGLLTDEWIVEGARPRKYYQLSPAGRQVLNRLTDQWAEIVNVMGSLLEGAPGVSNHGSD